MRSGLRSRFLVAVASLVLLAALLDQSTAQEFEDDEQAFAFDEDLEHNANDFLFRHEAFEIPLRVHIGLLGLSKRAGDKGGNYNLGVDARELERLLVSDLIYHTASTQEEGKEKPISNINFYMRYNARHLPFETLNIYEQLLAKSLKLVDGDQYHKGQEDESLMHAVYEIEIAGEIESFFDSLHKSITINSNLGDDNEYTVFLVNPRPEKFLPLPQSSKPTNQQWQAVKDLIGNHKANWYNAWKKQKGSDPPTLYNDDLMNDFDLTKEGPRYHYTYRGGAQTQSWIGRHRYVVIDLSADDAMYGPTVSGDGVIISGSVVPDVKRFVRIAKEAAAKSAQLITEGTKNDEANPPQEQGKEEQGGPAIINLSEYLSNMAELKASFILSIKSAIQHVFAADIRFSDIPFSDKILIPLIVFHNHAQFDPWDSSRIDMDEINAAIKRLTLPGQEIVVVKGQHSLHDHKHISMALAKSLNTESTYELKVSDDEENRFVPKRRTYVDSKALMMQMRDASDMLASGLLKTSKRLDLHRTFFNTDIPFIGYNQTRPKGLQGTRVLPVYIFSLGVSNDLLLDKSSSLVAASSDMVIVLQANNTKTKVPYFSGEQQLAVNPQDSTRHIIAGLLTALGGIVEPTKSFSPIKNKVLLDYSWAHGCHPFGYFSASSCVSQIFIDAVIRNSVVSRANKAIGAVVSAIESVENFGEKWGFNLPARADESGKNSWMEDLYHLPAIKSPITKDTIHRLHGEIRHLERKFIEAADLLSRYELEKAYKLSSSFGLISNRFKQYVEDELQSAETRMHCCETTHNIIESSSFASNLGSVLSYAVLMGIVFLIWLIIFPNQKTTRSFY